MRITGGKAKGIPLLAPKGNKTRPATDQMREALFSSLGHMAENSCFLDLFAGTGAYGLEALSRGAQMGRFIESDIKTTKILKQNLEQVLKSLAMSANPSQVMVKNVLKWEPLSGDSYDYIFADPPYTLTQKALPFIFNIAEKTLSQKPEARLIIETSGDFNIQKPCWETLKQLGKKGKDSPTLHILKPTSSQASHTE